MPCRCDDMEVRNINPNEEREKVLKDKCDELTQMLCWLCGRFYGKADLIEENKKLDSWWKNHQIDDKNRIEKEMRNAISNFSDPMNMAKAFIKKAEKVHMVSSFHKDMFYSIAISLFAEKEKAAREKKKKEDILDSIKKKLTPEELRNLEEHIRTTNNFSVKIKK